jgi:hypothetical protein
VEIACFATRRFARRLSSGERRSAVEASSSRISVLPAKIAAKLPPLGGPPLRLLSEFSGAKLLVPKPPVGMRIVTNPWHII